MSNRIFYAVQNVKLTPAFDGSPTVTTSGVVASGFQTVGVNGTVDFEQIFELGRLDIYQNLEGVPNVEITLERIIGSGMPTLFEAICGNTIPNASVARPTLDMTVADEASTPYSATNFVRCTGLYVSNYSVNFQIEGAMTESMTLVGNHLNWASGTGAPIVGSSTGNAFNDGTTPGAVVRRQDVTACSVGLDKLQSISFSMDFSREDLFELGSKSPYNKAAGFPIEVTAELEYLASTGVTGLTFTADQNTDITSDTPVTITAAGKTFSMGNARLTASNYSGGDAGGGNATISYSYLGYNFFQIS